MSLKFDFSQGKGRLTGISTLGVGFVATVLQRLSKALDENDSIEDERLAEILHAALKELFDQLVPAHMRAMRGKARRASQFASQGHQRELIREKLLTRASQGITEQAIDLISWRMPNSLGRRLRRKEVYRDVARSEVLKSLLRPLGRSSLFGDTTRLIRPNPSGRPVGASTGTIADRLAAILWKQIPREIRADWERVSNLVKCESACLESWFLSESEAYKVEDELPKALGLNFSKRVWKLQDDEKRKVIVRETFLHAVKRVVPYDREAVVDEFLDLFADVCINFLVLENDLPRVLKEFLSAQGAKSVIEYLERLFEIDDAESPARTAKIGTDLEEVAEQFRKTDRDFFLDLDQRLFVRPGGLLLTYLRPESGPLKTQGDVQTGPESWSRTFFNDAVRSIQPGVAPAAGATPRGAEVLSGDQAVSNALQRS